MYSVVVKKYGSPDVLEYVETASKKITDNSVRIKVHSVGVNFADILTIAALGKYLSPVAFGPCVLGLPDFVRHFCFVQFLRERCDFLSATSSYTLHQLPYIA